MLFFVIKSTTFTKKFLFIGFGRPNFGFSEIKFHKFAITLNLLLTCIMKEIIIFYQIKNSIKTQKSVIPLNFLLIKIYFDKLPNFDWWIFCPKNETF